MEEIVGYDCKVKADAPFAKNAYTARFIDSGTAFAGPEDVDHYQDVMKAVTKDLMSTFKAKYLACS